MNRLSVPGLSKDGGHQARRSESQESCGEGREYPAVVSEEFEQKITEEQDRNQRRSNLNSHRPARDIRPCHHAALEDNPGIRLEQRLEVECEPDH